MTSLQLTAPRVAALRRFAVGLGLLACATGAPCAEPHRPGVTQAEWEWLNGVHSALGHRDCKLAVSRLNDGLAGRYPDAFLLAGTMYEEGLCLKAQWDRAATMYQRALAAGHRGGRYRLIAGLAQREPAVALWWTQEGNIVWLPEACRVPAEAVRDAEAYATALQRWPPGRLAACAYLAGVASAISGDLEYPGDALGMLIEGTVRMQFIPAEARIEWRTTEVARLEPSGLMSGERVMERDAVKARDSLRRYLDELGKRALNRDRAAPPASDPGWLVNVEYVFTIR
jgi:TPR repeat protein